MDNRINNLSEANELAEVLKHVGNAIQYARFDGRGATKPAILLLLSALENAAAFVLVSRSPDSFASVSNARSAFEALIDMRAMLGDANHIRRMHQEFLSKKRNALTASIRMVHGLHPNSEEMKSLQRDLNQLDQEIQEIGKNKIAKKRREQLIEDHIDTSGVLLPFWCVLCDVSHNNINALAIRHFDLDEEGIERIVVHGALDRMLAESIVITLSSMIVDSANQLTTFVKGGQDEYLSHIAMAQAALWWVDDSPA
jgi:hypothetical protein